MRCSGHICHKVGSECSSFLPILEKDYFICNFGSNYKHKRFILWSGRVKTQISELAKYKIGQFRV